VRAGYRPVVSTSDRELNRLHVPPALRTIRRSPRERVGVLRLRRDGSSHSSAASPKARLGRQTRRYPVSVTPPVPSTRGKPPVAFPNAAPALANRRVSCGLNSAQWPVEIARRLRSVAADRSPALRHFPVAGSVPRSIPPHRSVAIRPPLDAYVLRWTIERSAVLSHHGSERLADAVAPFRVPWSR